MGGIYSLILEQSREHVLITYFEVIGAQERYKMLPAIHVMSVNCLKRGLLPHL